MKIREKIYLDLDGLEKHGPLNIVIFGDSISHGMFLGDPDYENVYWNILRKKLNSFRSYVPVNMICAAIGGTSASASLSRLKKQVLKHEPDAVIVCFGLNDVNGSLETYLRSLRIIFERCTEAGAEVIFMTPNMMNTYVAEDTPAQWREYAHKTAEMQNSGRMDLYIAEAMKLAADMGVTVCDCYSKWKELSQTQDTTLLLANRINHPNEDMHNLFAESLYETIMNN
ncbi:MAG: SGNH/GDSL hydrolase family protein [Ruminococcaceae bacterium]|nr:SGNH/GDSL hydrolase family protein [Oscillospiraceae bacterium]